MSLDDTASPSSGQKRKRTEDYRFNRDYQHHQHHPPHPPQRSRGRHAEGGFKQWSHSDQARINQIQEAEKHREFLAQEGQFVLQQKRKAAEIRVKEGRARPMDWLTVNLCVIDPIEDLINDDVSQEELDFTDPETVIQEASVEQLAVIKNEIEEFLSVERKSSNREYWRALQVLCTRPSRHGGKAVRSVSTDIDNLLVSKSYQELEKLEKQINRKLNSDEPIDTDYWQQLLESLLVYKAKAQLKNLYASFLDQRLARLRNDSQRAAQKAKLSLSNLPAPKLHYSRTLDPEPYLHLDSEDKTLQVLDERALLRAINRDRSQIIAARYVPASKNKVNANDLRIAPMAERHIEGVQTDSFLFENEASKGVDEDEEVFVGEEQVDPKTQDEQKGQYRLRKPRYFNRVQMGYEWNKYNQTHYDHDNPPPKVVQGYKFHIFYPDLIDVSKAPTYKIIREGGRKRGETVAPAGEEDTCIIRFISGPPYEDIAFRIVDRDWDYSAKHERGFKSTFDKGILTLHFSFKKVYYRK